MPKNTLYVTGFSRQTKAADLAPEFEKYGDLVRLDIPPPRTDDGEKYAFVEYKTADDCERALELNGKTFQYTIKDGLTVQIARSDPYSARRGGYRGNRGGFGYSRGGRGAYDYTSRDYPPRKDYDSRGYYASRGGDRSSGYGYNTENDYGYSSRGNYDNYRYEEDDYSRGGYGGRGHSRGGYGRGGYNRDGYRRGGFSRGGYDRERDGGERNYGAERERDSDYRSEREVVGPIYERPDEVNRQGDYEDSGRYERNSRHEVRRYSRSPSRSPVRRDRSRSPEHK